MEDAMTDAADMGYLQFNGDAKTNAKKLALSCDHGLVPRSLRAKNPRRHDASWAEPQQSKRTREA